MGFNYEDNFYYNEFGKKITKPFRIRVSNTPLDEQFSNLIKKFNVYRQIHSKFLKDNILLKLVWEEPQKNTDPNYGFRSWYRMNVPTASVKENSRSSIRKYIVRTRKLSTPERQYRTFQKSDETFKADFIREMKSLGISESSATKFNSQILYEEKSNYEKKLST